MSHIKKNYIRSKERLILSKIRLFRKFFCPQMLFIYSGLTAISYFYAEKLIFAFQVHKLFRYQQEWDERALATAFKNGAGITEIVRLS